MWTRWSPPKMANRALWARMTLGAPLVGVAVAGAAVVGAVAAAAKVPSSRRNRQRPGSMANRAMSLSPSPTSRSRQTVTPRQATDHRGAAGAVGVGAAIEASVARPSSTRPRQMAATRMRSVAATSPPGSPRREGRRPAKALLISRPPLSRRTMRSLSRMRLPPNRKLQHQSRCKRSRQPSPEDQPPGRLPMSRRRLSLRPRARPVAAGGSAF